MRSPPSILCVVSARGKAGGDRFFEGELIFGPTSACHKLLISLVIRTCFFTYPFFFVLSVCLVLFFFNGTKIAI